MTPDQAREASIRQTRRELDELTRLQQQALERLWQLTQDSPEQPRTAPAQR